jgi:hypothetical protein
MDPTTIIAGSLFTRDYLTEGIVEAPEWPGIEPEPLRANLEAIFARFPAASGPNESQTERDLIWPVLHRLGWAAHLEQQNLSASGREDVPDGILFLSDGAKAQANADPREWQRYAFGTAIVEAKRWDRPLDRRLGRDAESAPSTQMLRYLRRVEDLTGGALRWGILTNGARWRLYYQGARSVSEQFFEIDLAALLGLRQDLFDVAAEEGARAHWLRVFALMFARESFGPSPTDPRTFHQRALEEGRFYEQRVAGNLSAVVFQTVFPSLARAIAASAPAAPLQEVREAALILLYRLLFILYAEDRNLLPVRDSRYDDYAFRDRVRGDIGRRRDRGDTFSDTANRYWAVLDDLCRALDRGDASIGLPPYNGGLFDSERTPLLDQIRIPDSVMAEVIDLLSFERLDGTRRYINYRDLSVQQLGSIYERLLEFELKRDPAEGLIVRPNLFARKSSGSYYTPDELVQLILRETLEPLITERLDAFRARAAELASDPRDADIRLGSLRRVDPAEAMLTLRICDPAMGSGHFLVNLVDYVADQVIEAMAEAEVVVDWGSYVSPLADRITTIRDTVLGNAEAKGWTLDPAQLDDRHIVRRMVLKRCVYGVDKNPMAVELAKVSLWLHTFTVGAPLSFLDHHLRVGDSLFGAWVGKTLERLDRAGGRLLLNEPLRNATASAASMQTIEGLTDAEIAEAHRSAQIFDGVLSMTEPLDAFLKLFHAIDWLDLRDADDRAAVQAWLDGRFGDPVEIARGRLAVAPPRAEQAELIPDGRPQQADMLAPGPRADARQIARFAAILARARELIAEERFLNWEVAFPGVWRDWEGERSGGFDAVIGNPPWDRIKLQQVEWFAARERQIALAQRAADRAAMIQALVVENAPLARDYAKASGRAEAMSRMARMAGDYPLLSGGDTNLNSLFCERAAALIKSDGMIGLLIPSGISTETSSQEFFSKLIERGNAKVCLDFFNKRADGTLFFPDVYYRFKFTALVFGGAGRSFPECRFATFVRSLDELETPDRTYTLDMEHLRLVNPNSQTAPVYRAHRDRVISERIYEGFSPLVRHNGSSRKRVLPVRYTTLFHMANDSHQFRTRKELETREGAWRETGNIWASPNGRWVPLYEGKMVQAFDHRASGVAVVASNVYRSGQADLTTDEQHRDPGFTPEPRYFVPDDGQFDCEVALKDITSTTNARSLIACIIPPVGAGHTLPLIRMEDADRRRAATCKALLLASLNSTPVDFIARTKILSNHASWFIIEQLPVIPAADFESARFGPLAAGEVVRAAVLELTYTAHDMAPFARDLGHVDAAGEVLPPFAWDPARRLRLRAKLDAVFFHLYGIFDPRDRARSREDIAYIYSTFPIVERQEVRAFGSYSRAISASPTATAWRPDPIQKGFDDLNGADIF